MISQLKSSDRHIFSVDQQFKLQIVWSLPTFVCFLVLCHTPKFTYNLLANLWKICLQIIPFLYFTQGLKHFLSVLQIVQSLKFSIMNCGLWNVDEDDSKEALYKFFLEIAPQLWVRFLLEYLIPNFSFHAYLHSYLEKFRLWIFWCSAFVRQENGIHDNLTQLYA